MHTPWFLYDPCLCTSQLCFPALLWPKEPHVLDECSRSNSKAWSCLLSCASLTKSASPPDSTPEIGGPIFLITYHQNFRTVFILPPLHIYIMWVSKSSFFITKISLSPVSVWVGLPPLMASSLWLDPQVPWPVTFNSTLLSPSLCSNSLP